MKKECCVIITTTDNAKTAKLIAKTLVKAGLAACVQLDQVQSFFAMRDGLSRRKKFVYL